MPYATTRCIASFIVYQNLSKIGRIQLRVLQQRCDIEEVKIPSADNNDIDYKIMRNPLVFIIVLLIMINTIHQEHLLKWQNYRNG